MARPLRLLVLLLPLAGSLVPPTQITLNTERREKGLQQQQDDVFSRFKVAIETMQNEFFEYETACWPQSINWTSAVLQTLLAATIRTLTVPEYELSTKYFLQLVSFYFGQHSEALKMEAYDDMLWVVLGWLEAVKTIDHRVSVLTSDKLTGEEWRKAFAARALEFYEIAQHGWDETLCEGGMIWSPWLEPYKNAITNELFITASISMYLYHPYPPRNETYLWNAINAHEWLTASNMTDNTGLYVDGFHVSNLWTGGNKCDNRDEMVYTYNQGVVLSGLRGLAETTKDDKYIFEGMDLIDAVIKSEGMPGELVYNGVLTEKCDAGGYCSQDSQTFKGIFMHHLSIFCQPLPETGLFTSDTIRSHRLSCSRYRKFLIHNTNMAWITRNDAGVMGSWWGIPAGLRLSSFSTRDTRPAETADIRNMCNSRMTPEQCERDQRIHSYHKGNSSGSERHIQGRHFDLNDRGRGRSVESHSGGLAALRAVLEIPLLGID